MSLTFIQAVNRLRGECGITGSDLTSLAGLSGVNLRCKQWINDAYVELQAKQQDWEWLRASFSFVTVASQQVYTTTDAGIAATFGKWVPDSLRCYITASGYSTEQFLRHQPDYEAWRDVWQFGANRTVTGQPVEFAITPAKSLGLTPIPADDSYTILGDYYKMPAELSADSDTPAMPGQFHMILVYMAMMSYGVDEAATEIYQRGELKHRELLRKLMDDQLPNVCLPEPLL